MKKNVTLLILATVLLAVSCGTPRISFLGDSYTTFEGYIPEGNLVWYYCPPDTSLTDVSSVEQTWWYQVVTEGKYELDTNDSYSGATISFTGYDGLDFTDRSFITRLPRVGHPDVLVILGGTNDSWAPQRENTSMRISRRRTCTIIDPLWPNCFRTRSSGIPRPGCYLS